MTIEELDALRERAAQDYVLPTATTLALIDALKAARAGWSRESALATGEKVATATAMRQRDEAWALLREARENLASMGMRRGGPSTFDRMRADRGVADLHFRIDALLKEAHE